MMAAAAAAIAPEAWHLVNAASANSYPAQVSSFGLVPLNFQQSGTLGALDVKVGQRVRAGQLLASESTVTSSALVARDRSAVAADEQRLHVLESLANGAGAGSAASVAASYQGEINAAEAALTTAESAFTAELASANAQVASLQSQYSTVEGIFRQQCPGGPAAAGPSFSLEQCVQLYDSAQGAEQSLSNARQLVLSIQAQQSIAVAGATKALTDAQDAGAIAAQNPSVAYSYAVDLSAAQSQLAKDQAQLNSDLQIAAAGVLIAPNAGVVAEVAGGVGEQVSANGVGSVAPQGGLSQAQAGNSFLPTQAISQAAVSAFAPVIVLRTSSPLRITALVPQSAIGRVHLGARAEFIPEVHGLAPLRATVLQIGAFPEIANGTAEYAVIFEANGQSARGYMQGMVGTLRLS
ncbi:MAG: hypothetical protein M0Z91_02745 [Actinomycetota bacterium]|nr:hypothetical protein [Actinomycetota bacterium]